MPKKAAEYRGEQQAYVARQAHKMVTSSRYEELLKRAEDETSQHPEKDWRRILLKKSRRDYERKVALPADFVADWQNAAVMGQAAWLDARASRDFSRFQSALTKIVRLAREKCQLLKQNEETHYDILLADYDWGVTSRYLENLYVPLRKELVELSQCVQKERQLGHSSGKQKISEELQEKACHELLRAFGFDANVAVLARSAHPFSATLGPQDYRITTRYSADDFSGSFLGTAHEMGHSLYEQNLPSQYWGTMLGQAASFGVHESQSLFWEKQVTCSRSFLKNWWAKLRDLFAPSILDRATFEEFYEIFNRVEPGLIRVDADEVHYCLHIMVRFELEKALIEGELEACDLPGAWNEKYQSYIGIQPKDDLEGCLQDIHWSSGAFGYFPSYSIGHLIAAQLAEVMEREHHLSDLIVGENYPQILAALKSLIHEKGSMLDPLDLVEHSTGKPLSSDAFVEYLKNKYASRS